MAVFAGPPTLLFTDKETHKQSELQGGDRAGIRAQQGLVCNPVLRLLHPTDLSSAPLKHRPTKQKAATKSYLFCSCSCKSQLDTSFTSESDLSLLHPRYLALHRAKQHTSDIGAGHSVTSLLLQLQQLQVSSWLITLQTKVHLKKPFKLSMQVKCSREQVCISQSAELQ